MGFLCSMSRLRMEKEALSLKRFIVPSRRRHLPIRVRRGLLVSHRALSYCEDGPDTGSRCCYHSSAAPRRANQRPVLGEASRDGNRRSRQSRTRFDDSADAGTGEPHHVAIPDRPSSDGDGLLPAGRRSARIPPMSSPARTMDWDRSSMASSTTRRWRTRFPTSPRQTTN